MTAVGRIRALAFLAMAGTCARGVALADPAQRSETSNEAVRASAIAALAGLDALSATRLIPGAPTRKLVVLRTTPRPYSKGAIWTAELALEAGPPGRLSVPTELSLGFEVNAAGAVERSPARDDLASAVELALATEQRAFAAAEAAMSRAGEKPGPGARSWAEALAWARLDPRLPRASLVGEPSWQVGFGPFDAQTGYRNVVLDARTLRVTLVNGRPPR